MNHYFRHSIIVYRGINYHFLPDLDEFLNIYFLLAAGGWIVASPLHGDNPSQSYSRITTKLCYLFINSRHYFRQKFWFDQYYTDTLFVLLYTQ